jgi:hypothetical protein
MTLVLALMHGWTMIFGGLEPNTEYGLYRDGGEAHWAATLRLASFNTGDSLGPVISLLEMPSDTLWLAPRAFQPDTLVFLPKWAHRAWRATVWTGEASQLGNAFADLDWLMEVHSDTTSSIRIPAPLDNRRMRYAYWISYGSYEGEEWIMSEDFEMTISQEGMWEER